MFLRVLMNVGNDAPKLAVARHRYAPKGMLKQTACPTVGLIDGFGICVEEIRKFSGDRSKRFFGNLLGIMDFFFGFYPDQQMKMIAKQTKSEGLRHGFYVMGIKSQKMVEVALFIKNILAIRAAIVNVIEGVVLQRRRAGHILSVSIPKSGP